MNTYRYLIGGYWGEETDPLRPGPEDVALVMQQTADWEADGLIPEKGEKGNLRTDEELPW
jgi:hypothetical protein